MQYSEEFENELEDLEACAARMALTEKGTQEYETARSHFETILDDITNTYPVTTDMLTHHVEEVARTVRREHETRALKYVESLHNDFLNSLFNSYNPQF